MSKKDDTKAKPDYEGSTSSTTSVAATGQADVRRKG
jgi:hypothetical protein